jgi:hypothetical protein
MASGEVDSEVAWVALGSGKHCAQTNHAEVASAEATHLIDVDSPALPVLGTFVQRYEQM